MAGTNQEAGTTSQQLLADLHIRAESLLSKLKTYQKCLQDHNRYQDVEFRTFRRGIESEVKSLQTISKQFDSVNNHSQPDDGEDGIEEDLSELQLENLEARYLHALRSSNLPFYESVWQVASQCRGVVALGKKMYRASSQAEARRKQRGSSSTQDKKTQVKENHAGPKSGVVVDIVAEDGQKWIKVSTITEKRLLFEMAKEGWEKYGDYSSESEGSEHDRHLDSQERKSESKLELVRLAENLYAASRETRVHFKHPQVCFVLSSLEEGVTDDVDAVIADIRAAGCHVSCGIKADGQQTFSAGDQDTGEEAFLPLLPSNDIPSPTEKINVDCTILLALISDISHIPRSEIPCSPPNQSGHYHKAILKQLQQEEEQPLLTSEIYPFLAPSPAPTLSFSQTESEKGYKLICTDHAARRMREIVETMGTQSERDRADIIFGGGQYSRQSSQILRHALQQLSTHSVPNTLNLPITIINTGDERSSTAGPESTKSTTTTTTTTTATATTEPVSLPPKDIQIINLLAKSTHLSPINKSVFLHGGWTKGLVTITSNRAVAQSLVKAVNQMLDYLEQQQPQSHSLPLDENNNYGNDNISSTEDLHKMTCTIDTSDYKVGSKNTELRQPQLQSQPPHSIPSPSSSPPQPTPTTTMTTTTESRVKPEIQTQESDFHGPKIYLCETARSLIGKEKQGRNHFRSDD